MNRAAGPEKPTPALVLERLTKRFGRESAVLDFSLSLYPGRITALLGPSGCGKTTLLRLVAGLDTPDSGFVHLNGQRLDDVPAHRRNISLIFQQYALFPHKTVFENVAFGLRQRGVSGDALKDRVRAALERVRLDGYGGRLPGSLSGGEQQRVALARGIVVEPEVLLMDEPLSALDEHLRGEMRMELKELLASLRLTTLMVTHDQREALSMADHVVVMHRGVKLQEGSPREVYRRPRHRFVARFLGGGCILECVVERSVESGYEVRLASGARLMATGVYDMAVGGKAHVMVRPECVTVLEADAEASPEQADTGFNRLSGIVREVIFQGASISVTVQVGPGEILRSVRRAGDCELNVGDPVRVEVNRDDTILFS